ncbi:MAG: DUF423 domain-containing protein [Bradymonadaceae bacterium]
MIKIFTLAAAIFGALGVAAGAFGAHGLETQLHADALEIWETAATYQMYHALALLGTAWLAGETTSTATSVAGWCYVAGILVFSGSLYLLALTDIKWLGAITPIGGVSLIAGWIALFVAALSLG